MLPLPILHVRLQPCPEDWQQMTPTAQGRHCASCQRTVFDFTDKTSADLEAARAASPDGRLCGRFRAEQLAPPPRLRPKLRRFLVALVLVCGLGLTSQEAWAQVRKADQQQKVTPQPSNKQIEVPDQMPIISVGIVASPPADYVLNVPKVYNYVEQMPVFQEGGHEGALKFIEQHIRLPLTYPMLEGRVFVNCIIDKTGHIKETKVLKGIHPAYDAEALRLVQLLDGRFEPGRQNGQAVDVYYTFPVTFRHE
jgi:protein TonB